MEQLRDKVLATAKRMYRDSLVSGSSGNVSAYDPQSKHMYITASGIDYEDMTEADIVEMQTDGTVISGRGEPSSEWRMHALIYEKREDVRAVVHTHSPYATGFAVSHRPIPLVLIEMVPFLGGNVPLAEFALPGTAALGEKALEVLTDRSGCLLSNHGALTVGSNVDKAYLCAVYLEDAAKIYYNACSCGADPVIIPDEIALQMS